MPVNPMKQCPVTVSNVPRQAVLYTRVSSKEQELGYSIPAQQELLRSYGAQLGLVIEQELSDAETAKITGRPGFVGMVRYFKQHPACRVLRSEEHTSELQSPCNLVCRLLLEKKKRHDASRRRSRTFPVRDDDAARAWLR